MSSIVFEEFGDPDVLHLADLAVPEPGSAEVRVRVEATAVHPVDLFVRAGAIPALMPRNVEPPYVLGWDMAGVVDTVGADVTTWHPGDRVVGMTRWFDHGAGTYTDFAVFDADWLAPAPRGVSAVAAATLPLNAQTAVQALDLFELTSGQVLGVSGAAGALGGFVVELAAARGLRVVAVAGPGDETSVRRLGAAEFVPRAADLGRAVRAVAPAGVDGLLDAAVVGGAAIGAVRDGGTFVAVVEGAPEPERGIRVDTVSVRPDGRQLAELVSLVEQGELTLRVHDTYPYARAADAHSRMAKGGVRGRLVLVP